MCAHTLIFALGLWVSICECIGARKTGAGQLLNHWKPYQCFFQRVLPWVRHHRGKMASSASPRGHPQVTPWSKCPVLICRVLGASVHLGLGIKHGSGHIKRRNDQKWPGAMTLWYCVGARAVCHQHVGGSVQADVSCCRGGSDFSSLSLRPVFLLPLQLVLPEYSIHSLFCVMFLCAQEWLTLGLNVPLLFYHFWR